MKTFLKIGGVAALICAATYLVSIALYASLLAPFGDPALDFGRFMDFFLVNQGIVFVWHLLMYLINGSFLVILALALYDRLKAAAPEIARAATAFGLIWAALVLASGFITIYGWDLIPGLYASDPAQAAAFKLILETITTGIDHSDRFLGCLWVLLVSWAGLRTGRLPKALNYLGLLISIPGILSTVLPAANELGIMFGLVIIVWWTWLGIDLLRRYPNKESEIQIVTPETA